MKLELSRRQTHERLNEDYEWICTRALTGARQWLERRRARVACLGLRAVAGGYRAETGSWIGTEGDDVGLSIRSILDARGGQPQQGRYRRCI